MEIMNLPIVDLPFEHDDMSNEYEMDFNTFLYYAPNLDSESYEQLEKLIQTFVGADCWAVTVNNQVLFNSYYKKNIRNYILDDMVRDRIIENPHANLLVYLFRRKVDTRIRLYMFGGHTWTVNIDFKAKQKVFQVSFSQSLEHMNR